MTPLLPISNRVIDVGRFKGEFFSVFSRSSLDKGFGRPLPVVDSDPSLDTVGTSTHRVFRELSLGGDSYRQSTVDGRRFRPRRKINSDTTGTRRGSVTYSCYSIMWTNEEGSKSVGNTDRKGQRDQFWKEE